jgi:hypothetical protein
MTVPNSRTVKVRVRRIPDGWLSLVLVGERENGAGPFPTKRLAKQDARARAAKFAAAYSANTH